MTFTNQQIIDLSAAITALDGTHVTQIVEGKAVQVWRGYKLSAKARWTLARNQGRLQAAIADINRAVDAAVLQHSGGDPAISPQSPGWNKFCEDRAGLLKEKTEVALAQITEADLADNEIPIAVLNALLPIIA